MASLGRPYKECNRVFLRQNALYGKPGSLATFYLVQDYIDFGKTHADDVIMVIGAKTNIKPKSLERLGFNKLETSYRLKTK